MSSVNRRLGLRKPCPLIRPGIYTGNATRYRAVIDHASTRAGHEVNKRRKPRHAPVPLNGSGQSNPIGGFRHPERRPRRGLNGQMRPVDHASRATESSRSFEPAGARYDQ